MIRFKPFIVTSLLVLLLYTGYGMYISIILFLITVAVTYICFTLNTQLRLEKCIAYLIRFGQESSHPVANIKEDNRDNNRLKSLPLPFCKISKKFIKSIINDFIKTWYIHIGPTEKDFLNEVEVALEFIAVEVYFQLKCLDVSNVVINLIRMFQRHIKVFDDCRNVVQKKYAGISEEDLCNCITELYEASNFRHIATRSKGAEIDYLKALLDIFLFKFLPENAFSCEGGRFLLREILTTRLLDPVIKDLTDSYFVNQAVLDILHPSVPLPIIIERWNDVVKEMESTEEEHLSFEEPDISSVEADYGSGLDENKWKQNVDQPSVQLKTTRSASLTQKSFDSNNKDNKEVLRFDKLDLRTSAPVYGCVSVRDHEKLKEQANLLNSKSINPVDSHSRLAKHRFSDSDGNSFVSHEKSISESFHTYNSIVSKEPQWPSSWAVCPPPDASLFQQASFAEMSRKQDDMSEQMKHKLSCMDLPDVKQMTWVGNILPGYIHAGDTRNSTNETLDVSDAMELSMKYMEPMITSITVSQITEKALTDSASDTLEESAPCELTHDGTEDAADTSSCPLCIEMTLMASPFETEKEKVLYNPKKSISEHDCGLNFKHFYYAETNTEVPSGEPTDDHRFASCEDLVTQSLNLSDTFIQSIECDPDTLVDSDRHDGYDVVLLQTEDWSHSDNSSDESLSFDEVEQFPSDDEYTDSYKRIYGSPSEATFKTVLGSVSNNDTDLPKKKKRNQIYSDVKHVVTAYGDNDADDDEDVYYDDNDDDINVPEHINSNTHVIKKQISKSNNKFINFFKGFPSLSKKRLWLSHSKRRNGDQIKNISNIKKKKNNCSSSASTTQTKFISLPDNTSSSLPTHINPPYPTINDYVEEVALEAVENDEYFELFPTPIDKIAVDPLSKEITVTEKGLAGDCRPIKSLKSVNETRLKSLSDNLGKGSSGQAKGDSLQFLPIFEGEVIKPHPSKIPAAWHYPIQMVSIPCTEIAHEKGWEPGINKYTLYSIHYDIRIWPDIYQKKVLEATTQSESEESPLPLIREIKRRYREFLYLHNRFTHGPLSKNMKGILRPNRRYAMPFGRMDPDVIEGRRRILETYLVSLVSRPQLCNSREFKEFLGSEDHEDMAVGKSTKVAQKQVCNSHIMATVKVADGQVSHGISTHYLGQKDQVERLNRGLDSQYFIHGYEVQRMFGYADKLNLKRNSTILFTYFVENYHTICKSSVHIFPTNTIPVHCDISTAAVYPTNKAQRMESCSDNKEKDIPLGPRTAGDGAEKCDEVVEESSVKKMEIPYASVIAAKFSPELASQLEKENLELLVAREKDLYESSWPLTDAVLSISCQALKGLGSWISFERVQQAILFSIGGVIEWLIKRELDEYSMKERCYKYFSDIYALLWNDNGTLKEKKPRPTMEERERVKLQALNSLMEVLPRFLMMSIGPNNYRKCCENLLHTLQYQAVNRHLLFAALEIILFDLIPDLRNGYPEYIARS